MSPLSLLFSSDEETSCELRQALKELDLKVEHCPEIFAAVEKLTSRSFEVIVADWDEGLEASFLLKTARELKSNRSAFSIAITDPSANATARQVADLVLNKPIVASQIKYALLTNDEFLAHMKNWLPQVAAPPTQQPAVPIPANPAWPVTPRNEFRPETITERSPKPSPPPQARVSANVPVNFPFGTFEASGVYESAIQTLFQPDTWRAEPSRPKPRKGRSIFLRGVGVGVAFLALGYVLSPPLRAAAVATSVANICHRALEKTQAWLRTPTAEAAAPSQTAQNVNSRPVRLRPTPIQVTPVASPPVADVAKPAIGPPESSEAKPQPVAVAAGPHIPDSLKVPIQTAMLRSVTARVTPSLLGGLEPVDLPEDLAQELLLEKVPPSYPEQALKAGLQGPVVLQAWIARDGTIRDLKLIHGSFLLGQAAYQAVKQWRYKPYLLNGQAVEAQTYVTVDFKLP
jgi:TonB family protein